jgi:DNA-binding transcriptional MerR regulator
MEPALDRKAPEAFRSISEVADELDLPQHVLRFWESRFHDIRPMKRGGGRRYYRPDDISLLRGIRHLLYGEGYTIRGVQRILREQGARFVQAVWQDGAPQPPHGAHEEPELAEEADAPAVEPEGEQRSLRGRIVSLVGVDFSDTLTKVDKRREPPLHSAPEPRIEPADRAIHCEPEPEPAMAMAPPAPAAPVVDATPPEPARPPEPISRLAHDDMRKLRTVLQDLVECRKLAEAVRAN